MIKKIWFLLALSFTSLPSSTHPHNLAYYLSEGQKCFIATYSPHHMKFYAPFNAGDVVFHSGNITQILQAQHDNNGTYFRTEKKDVSKTAPSFIFAISGVDPSIFEDEISRDIRNNIPAQNILQTLLRLNLGLNQTPMALLTFNRWDFPVWMIETLTYRLVKASPFLNNPSITCPELRRYDNKFPENFLSPPQHLTLRWEGRS